ncbi:MAG: DUF6688 family protein [Bacteroidota bacterium]
MLGINVVFVVILILVPFVLCIWRFARFATGLRQARNLSDVADFYPIGKKRQLLNHRIRVDFPEFLFMGVAPVLGSMFIYYFRHDIHPFAIDHTPTLLAFISVAYVSYWVSRLAKRRISPLLYAILPLGMLIGCLLYGAMFFHFISGMTILGAVVFPYYAFALYAPIPALLYNVRELILHNRYYMDKMHGDSWYHPVRQSGIFKFLSKGAWAFRPTYYLLLLPTIFTLQALMLQFGQEPMSIIHVFTEGKDFLFSEEGSPW